MFIIRGGLGCEIVRSQRAEQTAALRARVLFSFRRVAACALAVRKTIRGTHVHINIHISSYGVRPTGPSVSLDLSSTPEVRRLLLVTCPRSVCTKPRNQRHPTRPRSRSDGLAAPPWATRLRRPAANAPDATAAATVTARTAGCPRLPADSPPPVRNAPRTAYLVRVRVCGRLCLLLFFSKP